ncbi:maltose alpha-D-glucosyltransferase [Chondrinema litorale]|uniref:maltose alpha-D-glucosyltransferase n=1 Tax=Chondrinema litorale TaxID=2994555 RepID=UPI0025431569|nr:maltose alpha-D-glucosyltransferase [Chondrinema litorale]UZR95916.1 maltose alpha-D-glucosyltransferase [Chondrinema litorale]
MTEQKADFRNDNLWYKDAIIYELHIKAFQDSNSDGIGDFKGLLKRLDYLHDLGITAIWLLPFYPSPQKDGGYDIADYYSINPSYGKIKHFKKFLDKAHKLDMKVITELVLNHTSDQHPWFQRARNSPAGSNYRNYYVWSDSQEKYKDTRIIFQDFETSNWTWDSVANAYYWHRFYSHQPDLNFDHPEVQEEVFNILDFWLDLGVDGFRLDAVPYLFEREGTNCENLPETHVFLKKLRKHIDEKYTNKMFLAEANMWPEDSAAYFGDGDECHMNYHFPIMPRLFMSLKLEDRHPIIDIIEQTPAIPENCQWAMFLRNHDELTLEMVTDEERDYMYRAYTKDSKAKINLGIRHRLAPLLDNNRKKIELMNYLLFSLPGTPVIYYGDEIGMGDNIYLGDRDGVRTPMQWSSDRNGGFSQINPQKLYLPNISDPEYSFDAVNVETQQDNTSSLLWWMKRVIDMRKRYKAFSRGSIQFLSPDNAKVLAFVRSYENQHILVLANLSRFSQGVEIELDEFEDYIPVDVFSRNKFPKITNKPYLFTLGPHGYFWFQLKNSKPGIQDLIPDLEITGIHYSDIFKKNNLKILEQEIIPTYLNNSKWFEGKDRVIRKVVIKQRRNVKLSDRNAFMLYMHIEFNDGFPEYYLLPVLIVSDAEKESLNGNTNDKIVGTYFINNEKFWILEAAVSPNFREKLIFQFFDNKKHKGESVDILKFALNEGEKGQVDTSEFIGHSKLIDTRKGNTGITYSNKYFLKMYRRLDKAPNPDYETVKFLSENTDFPYVPKFKGEITWANNNDFVSVTGMLQEYIPNQGNAKLYFEDVIKRYYERVFSVRNNFDCQDIEVEVFEGLPEKEKYNWYEEVIGNVVIERASLLGLITAQLHQELAAHPQVIGFERENFSLHYQKSLFSALQSSIRLNFQLINKKSHLFSEATQEELNKLVENKDAIVTLLKKLQDDKIDTLKTRIHGNLHLGNVLFTGKDFYINDFEGDATRAFSEKRLKKSPLKDIASLLRSFHYAAYNAIFHKGVVRTEDIPFLKEWSDKWYKYVANRMLNSYYENMHDMAILPEEKEQFQFLLEVFLIERAFYELKLEILRESDKAWLPARAINDLITKD